MFYFHIHYGHFFIVIPSQNEKNLIYFEWLTHILKSGDSIVNKDEINIPRLLIVTALELEYKAVRYFLREIYEEKHETGIIYERGKYHTEKGQWDILIVQSDRGNINSAIETNKAIEYFQPDIAFFIGIAGGIKDVKIGDVVAATDVHYIEYGKDSDQFLPRTESKSCNYKLKEKAKAEARKEDWAKLIDPNISRQKPNVFVAPIAVGEKILTNVNSKLYNFIKNQYSQCLAVEMEGKGFLDATFQHQEISTLIIRGISDLIDKKEESDAHGNQPIAAHHACAFAFYLLSQLYYSSIVKKASPEPSQSQESKISDSIIDLKVRLTEESLGKELDECKDLVKQHKYKEAKILFERLKNKKWSDLKEKQKRSVLTNLAHIQMKNCEYKEAAELLFQAKDYGHDDEDTLLNLIVAHNLNGDKEKAFQLAISYKERLEHSKEFWSNYIQVLPPEISTEQIQKEIPSEFINNSYILTNLALRANLSGNNLEGERLAHEACDSDPNNGLAWNIQGICIFAQILSIIDDYNTLSLPGNILDNLKRAENCFTEAITLGEREKDKGMLFEAYQKRYITRKYLGKIHDAEQDKEKYVYLIPDNPFSLIEQGKDSFSRGDINRAEECFRSALEHDRENIYAKHELAIILQNNDSPEKKREAIELHLQLLSDNKVTFNYKIQTLNELIKISRNLNDLKSLETFIKENIKSQPDTIMPYIQMSILLMEKEQDEKAKDSIMKAYNLINRDTPRHVIRCIAQVLTKLKFYEVSLELWLRITDPVDGSYDYKSLIHCAGIMGKHDIVLQTCEKIRESGKWDEELIKNIEFPLLQRYDPLKAMEILQKRIQSNPDDRYAHIFLSFLGIQFHRKDLLVFKPSMVPETNDVEKSLGIDIVEALLACGYTSESLDLGYRLLRIYYGDLDVKKVYCGIFLAEPLKNIQLKIDEPQIILPGCAVCFSRIDHEVDKWIVIEEKDNPKRELCELSPDDHLSQKLINHKVGDEVLLEDIHFEIKVKIKAIKSKYLYRWHEILEESHNISYEGQFIWGFSAKKPGMKEDEYDFTPLIEMGKKQYEQEKEIEDLYIKYPCPLYFLRHNTFKSTCVVAIEKPQLRVNCCTGNDAERYFVNLILSGNNSIVLDLTAIASIWLLQWNNIFSLLRDRLFIGPMTKYILWETIDELARSGLSIVSAPNGFYPQIRSEENTNKLKEYISKFKNDIEENVKVTNCYELAAMDKKWREETTQRFGEDGVETIAISKRLNHILWTDDITVAIYASKFSKTKSRIWTYAVSEYMFNNKRISEEDHLSNCARLLGWGYWFTPFNEKVLMKLCELTDWKFTSPLFEPLFEQIKDPNTIGNRLPRILTQFFSILYKEPLIKESRDIFLIRFLETILSRPNDGVRIIQQIKQSIPSAFGLNVIGKKDILTIINQWLKVR